MSAEVVDVAWVIAAMLALLVIGQAIGVAVIATDLRIIRRALSPQSAHKLSQADVMADAVRAYLKEHCRPYSKNAAAAYERLLDACETYRGGR